MNPNPHRSPPPPALNRTAQHSFAVPSTWWVLGAPGLALGGTCVLVVAGAPGDWIGALWLAAVLWTIVGSFVHALHAGIRHGDWSAFACEVLPHSQVLPRCQALATDDDDHDYFFRSGSYAYLRVRDEHEMLMREGDRYLEDHDQTGSLS